MQCGPKHGWQNTALRHASSPKQNIKCVSKLLCLSAVQVILMVRIGSGNYKVQRLTATCWAAKYRLNPQNFILNSRSHSNIYNYNEYTGSLSASMSSSNKSLQNILYVIQSQSEKYDATPLKGKYTQK